MIEEMESRKRERQTDEETLFGISVMAGQVSEHPGMFYSNVLNSTKRTECSPDNMFGQERETGESINGAGHTRGRLYVPDIPSEAIRQKAVRERTTGRQANDFHTCKIYLPSGKHQLKVNFNVFIYKDRMIYKRIKNEFVIIGPVTFLPTFW